MCSDLDSPGIESRHIPDQGEEFIITGHIGNGEVVCAFYQSSCRLVARVSTMFWISCTPACTTWIRAVRMASSAGIFRSASACPLFVVPVAPGHPGFKNLPVQCIGFFPAGFTGLHDKAGSPSQTDFDCLCGFCISRRGMPVRRSWFCRV